MHLQPSIQFTVRYFLKNLKLWNTYTAYNTQRPLFSFNRDWYYRANVPLDVRIRVGRAITSLRLEDKMRQIISKGADISESLDCGNPNGSIGVEIVGPVIALVVGILALVICIALLRGCIVQQKAKGGYRRQERL